MLVGHRFVLLPGLLPKSSVPTERFQSRAQDGTERLRMDAKVREARAPAQRVRQGCPETCPPAASCTQPRPGSRPFRHLSGCLHEPSQESASLLSTPGCICLAHLTFGERGHVIDESDSQLCLMPVELLSPMGSVPSPGLDVATCFRETQKEKNTWGAEGGFGLIHFKLFACHQVARTDTLCQGWGQPPSSRKYFLKM